MKVYVLRNCRSDMTSYNGFVWPESGFVECPDWDSIPSCGNGLHGFLWGIGDADLLYKGDCKYLIVEVDENLIVNLGGKVKFPHGNVVFCTADKYAAGAKMIEFGADPATCMFSQVTTGDGGTSVSGNCGNSISGHHGNSTSGDYGKSISGRNGNSISGHWGNSTSGDYGSSTSGYRGNSTSGYWGNSISGYCGTSTSGHRGNSTSGNFGTSVSGDYGSSISGHHGNSTSGDYGSSTSGWSGTVQTGIGGICILMHYTEDTGYIKKVLTDPKPNVKYKLNDNGEFIEVI